MHTHGRNSLNMMLSIDNLEEEDMKKTNYTNRPEAYIEPKVKIVDMSCEGVLCVSQLFMLESYEEGETYSLDFSLF